MSKEFSINSLLSGETLKKSNTFTRKIHYSKLIPNENNTYSMNHLEDLADNIQDFGLLQNLVAKPLPDSDMYVLIAGHRRREAIRILVEERGLTEFEMIDTNLLSEDEDQNISLIKLHATNLLARDLSSYEKVTAVSELKNLIQQAKNDGFPIKGKMRDLIADEVGLSPTQVQKMLTVDAKADDSTREALKDGSLSLEKAYESLKNPSPEKAEEKASPTNHQPKLFDPYKELQKLEKSCGKLLDKFIDEGVESQELSNILGKIGLLKDQY